MTNNGRPKSPCYKCEERTAECHATCSKYQAWVIITKQANEHMHSERVKDRIDPRQGNMSWSLKNRLRKMRSK